MFRVEPVGSYRKGKPVERFHLVCNAHLDPVWLWEWEEGAAEAVATFRTAAELCEEYDGFVFNHNEAILYQWIETFDPDLFERIRGLVRRKKWHIMGGWYLQPDCNMPAGESLVRQILLGRRYFEEKFGVSPRVAINFDPFGHCRGLVQVLAKSGYRGYLVCRPPAEDLPLEDDRFVWEGYDGSRVLATRAEGMYNSGPGQARSKAEKVMESQAGRKATVILWGVGNHGGGPSRRDLRELAPLLTSTSSRRVKHSTPESYFAELAREQDTLPVFRDSLNPWGVGCYTSQVRIKQTHRRLENELYGTEKICAHAWLLGLADHPGSELRRVGDTPPTGQLPDILPGSGIQPVEDYSLRLMHSALEQLSRIRLKAFFDLSRTLKPARGGSLPVLVYNPHPFPVTTTVECELQLSDWNLRPDRRTVYEVRRGSTLQASQIEKELSNISVDWRKRVIFRASLPAAKMTRFDCTPRMEPSAPEPVRAVSGKEYRFTTRELEVVINPRTGLLDRYRVRGTDMLGTGAGRCMVMRDNEDPWGMRVRKFRAREGSFRLLDARKAARFCGVSGPSLPPVRIIEEGAVRTVVEAVFGYGDSFLCRRYKLPAEGTALEIENILYWNEKDRMLKLSFPAFDRGVSALRQTAFGREDVPDTGEETVMQQWAAMVSPDGKHAVSFLNDGIYGVDFRSDEIRFSLVRSPAYSGSPVMDRPIVRNDRFSPRIDQGERRFVLWIDGGDAARMLREIDREASVRNQKPCVLPMAPRGGGPKPASLVRINNPAVQLSGVKQSADAADLIIRLYEATGSACRATVTVGALDTSRQLSFGPFEIRTFRISPESGRWTETDMLERVADKRGVR